MASNTIRQRALPSLLHPVRSVPFAMRATTTPSARRFLSEKPGLESTDIRDIADARKTHPPQPKISNASVGGEKLTEEQKREVDEHNKDFEKKHDTAAPADKDNVDKKFWSNRDSGM
ncbi:uracil permease [Colletotrichum tofieldiae]|nr:uracil permease [Colletotrichum tofieldiae]GKT81313.1 uracil permease [Colletotrichum tofieldiae]